MTNTDRQARAEREVLTFLFGTADPALMTKDQLAGACRIHAYARDIERAVWREAARITTQWRPARKMNARTGFDARTELIAKYKQRAEE